MSPAQLVFGGSAVIALTGALLAVGLRNIFHNILGFAFAMLGVAGMLLALGSDFLALVFALVYVGAVAIAMVYAVMLSHPIDQPQLARSTPKAVGAGLLAGAAAWAVWQVLRHAPWAPAAPNPAAAGAARVGWRFLTDYVLVFELISVLLVVAMMGAVMVARRSGEGRGTW